MMTLIHPIPDAIPATLLTLALEIATDAHRTHAPRKISGKPYITHPKAVADRLTDERLKPLGLLHDVMEDHPDVYPESRMRELLPPWVVDHLLLLTRLPDEPYDLFILRAGSTQATREVKIADIRDNLRDLTKGSLRDKYRLAIRLLGEDPDRCV